DKTDSSTLIKNEVRMMISCLAYNISLFMRHLAGGSVKNLTMKRFRKLFINIAGKCVKSGSIISCVESLLSMQLFL
ncbi:hypothetical protein E5983_09485, partial [Streptococcus danieliae]|nr:hypothetical protein [Streptococcus danieliae]